MKGINLIDAFNIDSFYSPLKQKKRQRKLSIIPKQIQYSHSVLRNFPIANDRIPELKAKSIPKSEYRNKLYCIHNSRISAASAFPSIHLIKPMESNHFKLSSGKLAHCLIHRTRQGSVVGSISKAKENISDSVGKIKLKPLIGRNEIGVCHKSMQIELSNDITNMPTNYGRSTIYTSRVKEIIFNDPLCGWDYQNTNGTETPALTDH